MGRPKKSSGGEDSGTESNRDTVTMSRSKRSVKPPARYVEDAAEEGEEDEDMGEVSTEAS